MNNLSHRIFSYLLIHDMGCITLLYRVVYLKDT